jgi:hypothetical protein
MLTDFRGDEAKKNVKKKSKMANSKKLSFSKTPILNNFWPTFQGCPWVSRKN